MTVSGKRIIIGIFGVALLAAVFAQWYHQFSQRRTLAYFGPNALALISGAAKTEILRLTPQSDRRLKTDRGGGVIAYGDQRLYVERTLEIDAAKGLIHARTALVDDSSFNWNDQRPDCTPQWTEGLRYSTGNSSAVVLLAYDCRLAALAGSRRPVQMTQQLSDAMQQFIQAQWAAAPAGETKSN